MALAEVCPQYAACPGGEDAVLKTVDPKGFAGSNPVCSAECLISTFNPFCIPYWEKLIVTIYRQNEHIIYMFVLFF